MKSPTEDGNTEDEEATCSIMTDFDYDDTMQKGMRSINFEIVWKVFET